MKLHKKLEQLKFTIGCVSTNNGTYEQYARITLWRLGSNLYKVTIEEFDDLAKSDVYEEYLCNKRKAYTIWSNSFFKYSELEEVFNANPY